MQSLKNVTGIVLAGGLSRRMGGNNKALLPVNGRPMIEHITSQMQGHFYEIIIGSGKKTDYSFLGCRVINDIPGEEGPLAGIAPCLESAKTDFCFVTACDIPQISIPFIEKMLSVAGNAKMVIPVSGEGKYEPLHALYRRSVSAFARELLANGNRKVADLMKFGFLSFDFSNEEWYRNLNTSDDYTDFISKG